MWLSGNLEGLCKFSTLSLSLSHIRTPSNSPKPKPLSHIKLSSILQTDGVKDSDTLYFILLSECAVTHLCDFSTVPYSADSLECGEKCEFFPQKNSLFIWIAKTILWVDSESLLWIQNQFVQRQEMKWQRDKLRHPNCHAEKLLFICKTDAFLLLIIYIMLYVRMFYKYTMPIV